jgi:phosphoglycolate phosphatase
MNRLAIFDFDGTIVDSAAILERALHEAFGSIGRTSPGIQCCRRVIGLSLLEAASKLLPDADARTVGQFATAYKDVLARIRSESSDAEPLFEGIVVLLDALESEGWLLAIATGNTRRGIERPLQVHGIEARFISMQTADDHPSKPHPSMVLRAMQDAGAGPSSTIVIGDTSFDMQMAIAAGARPIGAGWGCHKPGDLIAAGAAAVALEPRAVAGILHDLASDPILTRFWRGLEDGSHAAGKSVKRANASHAGRLSSRLTGAPNSRTCS